MAKMKVLPHEKLGISFAELGALLGTLSMLENGVVVGTKKLSAVPGKHLFNMDKWEDTDACGTVACIGGHMQYILGKRPPSFYWDAVTDTSAAEAVNRRRELFFPLGMSSFSHITVDQAIVAIKHFLATGKADWSHVKR